MADTNSLLENLFAEDGGMTNAGKFSAISSIASPTLQALSVNKNGTSNAGLNMGSKALSYGSMGFSVGGPIGAAIGGAAGLAHGAFESKKQNDLIAQRKKERDEMMAKLQKNKDNMRLADHNFSGYNTGFYVLGGKLNNNTMSNNKKLQSRGNMPKVMALGGKLNNNTMNNIRPISETGAKLLGPKHEQGGIKIGNDEVEGGEILSKDEQDGTTRVFSDRLGYAEQAEALEVRKGKILRELMEIKNSINSNEVNVTGKKLQDNELKRNTSALSAKAKHLEAQLEMVNAQLDKMYEVQSEQANDINNQNQAQGDMGMGQQMQVPEDASMEMPQSGQMMALGGSLPDGDKNRRKKKNNLPNIERGLGYSYNKAGDNQPPTNKQMNTFEARRPITDIAKEKRIRKREEQIGGVIRDGALAKHTGEALARTLNIDNEKAYTVVNELSKLSEDGSYHNKPDNVKRNEIFNIIKVQLPNVSDEEIERVSNDFVRGVIKLEDFKPSSKYEGSLTQYNIALKKHSKFKDKRWNPYFNNDNSIKALGGTLGNDPTYGNDPIYGNDPTYGNDRWRLLNSKYKNLDFVQRGLDPNRNSIKYGNKTASHRLAAEQDQDGSWMVFPTIINNNGKLEEIKNRKRAMQIAKERGEYIPFTDKDKDIAKAKAIAYSKSGLIEHGNENEGMPVGSLSTMPSKGFSPITLDKKEPELQLLPEDKDKESSGFNFNNLNKLVPYADNIANAILSSKHPDIQRPTLDSYRPFETNYDISSSLNESTRATRAAREYNRNNLSAGNVESSANRATTASEIAQRNKLYQDKVNKETGMRNQNINLRNQLESRNNIKLDRFNESQRQLQEQKITEISQNVADAVSDYNKQATWDDKVDYQNMQLLIEASRTKDSSTMLSVLNNPAFVKRASEDPKFKETVKGIYDMLVADGDTKKAQEVANLYKF